MNVQRLNNINLDLTGIPNTVIIDSGGAEETAYNPNDIFNGGSSGTSVDSATLTEQVNQSNLLTGANNKIDTTNTNLTSLVAEVQDIKNSANGIFTNTWNIQQNTNLLLISTIKYKVNITNTANIGDIIVESIFRDNTGNRIYEYYNETQQSFIGNSFPLNELVDIKTPILRTTQTWSTYGGGGTYSILAPNNNRVKIVIKHTTTNFLIDYNKPINFLFNDGSSSPDGKTHSWQFKKDDEQIVFEGLDICKLELLAQCDTDFELTIEEWI